MSPSLIWVEILKIARRRGMLLSAIGLTCFAVLATFVTFWILHVRDEAEHPSAGGDGSFGIAVTFVSLLATVFAALIGARAGAYDEENGLMRYWTVTGLSRTDLFLARIPAAIAVVVAAVVPAVVLAILLAVVLPVADGDALRAGTVGTVLWGIVLGIVVWTAISVSIGALLRSTGAGIAISFVLAFVADTALSLRSLVGDRLPEIAPSNAISVLTDADGASGSIGVAILVLALWIAVPATAAARRTAASEY